MPVTRNPCTAYFAFSSSKCGKIFSFLFLRFCIFVIVITAYGCAEFASCKKDVKC